MDPYYYQTGIRKSIEEDRAEIMAAFRDIVQGGLGVQLKLVNYYKGLPISYPATLVEVNGDVLELDVHPQQAVALGVSKRTCIKCSHFDSHLLAEVKDSDVRRMMASLTNLSYVQIMAEQRVSLRLELEEPCQALLKLAGGTEEAQVLDISLGGFSVRTNRSCGLEKGAEVQLKVMVPNLVQNSDIPVEMTATVVGGECDADGELIRFSIASDPNAEGIISRFIFQRQVDLIREIKDQS